MKYLIAVAILLSSLAGCGQNEQNNSQKQNSEQPSKVHQKKEAKQHKAEKDGKTLQLNDGQKWETDLSTRKGMHNIDSLLTTYDQRQALNSTDYKRVGEQLKSEMQRIHQKCSMEGQSHEELHKFINKIHPHIQNLMAGNILKAIQSFEKLNLLLEQYKEYFH